MASKLKYNGSWHEKCQLPSVSADVLEDLETILEDRPSTLSAIRLVRALLQI
jgi:hypothetical protein